MYKFLICFVLVLVAEAKPPFTDTADVAVQFNSTNKNVRPNGLNAIANNFYATNLNGKVTTTNTGALGRDLIAIMGDVANVNDFGAFSDGITDTSVNIQNAINSNPIGVSGRYNLTQPSGIVYLPPGKYAIGTALKLTSGTTLRGSGRDATVLVGLTTSNNIIECLDGGPNVIQPNFIIENLSIEGRTNASAGAGIQVALNTTNLTSPRIHIRDVSINFCYNSLLLSNIVGGTVERSEFIAAANNNLEQKGSMNVVSFIDCLFESAGKYGAHVSPNYCSFLTCAFEFNTNAGAYFFDNGGGVGGANSQMVSCGFEQNPGYGLQMDNSICMDIINPYFAGNGSNSIHAAGIKSSQLRGVRDSSGSGWSIFMTNGTGGSVPTGNVLSYYTLGGSLGTVNDLSSFFQPSFQGGYKSAWGNDAVTVTWPSGVGQVTANKLTARSGSTTNEVDITHNGAKGLVNVTNGDLEVNSTGQFKVDVLESNVGIVPTVSDTYDVGTSNFKYRLGYFTRNPVPNRAITLSVTTNSTLTISAGTIPVVGNGGAITLVSTPTVSTNAADNELIRIMGTSASSTVTFQDSGTLANSSLKLNAATITLGLGDCLTLQFDAVALIWRQIVPVYNTIQPLNVNLTALANNVSNGIWVRTGVGTGSARTIIGSADIPVTNGDGVAGNPTLGVINNGVVTYAKIQNVTASRLLGREASGAGAVEEITLGTGLALTGTTVGVDYTVATNTTTICLSDTINTIAAGANKQYWDLPYAVTFKDVKLTLGTTSSSGPVTVNVKKNGSTIFSVEPSIASGSVSTTTPATLSVTTANAGDRLTFDIDAGGTGAINLQATLYNVKR